MMSAVNRAGGVFTTLCAAGAELEVTPWSWKKQASGAEQSDIPDPGSATSTH